MTFELLGNSGNALDALERLGDIPTGLNAVAVGLPEGSNDYPDGTSIIMVGTVHEFGSEARGIPQRSYLRSTVVENKREYKSLHRKLALKVVRGEMTTERALATIGLIVQRDVVAKITDISDPPLKHRRDKEGALGNPLVKTGHLRRAITFKIG